MSVVRPARGLLGRCLASTSLVPSASAPCRQFHVSASRAKRRTRFKNVKAEELGLTQPAAMAEYQKKHTPEYSTEDMAQFREKYSPEQIDAILAGEKAVDPKDIIMQGRLRRDDNRPEYVDDYTEFDPRYDIKPQERFEAKEPVFLSKDAWIQDYTNKIMEFTTKKSDEQFTRAMVRALRKVKESHGEELIDLTNEELNDIDKHPELIHRYINAEDGPEPAPDASGPEYMTRAQAEKLNEAIDEAMVEEIDKMEGMEGSEFGPTGVAAMVNSPLGVSRYETAEAMELGKVPGVVSEQDETEDQVQAPPGTDPEQLEELMRTTGLSSETISSLYNKVLVNRFVSNQTRLGKIRSSSVLAIAGNGNGWLGLGMAKSTEVGVAHSTARFLAIKNMKPIRRYENRTIFGKVKAKVSGTVVEIAARPPGFGLRCPHRFFEMCRASGIHDIAARMPRSKNPMNSVKAMYQALMNQPNPEDMAVGRGKKMVDVRKVYYGGDVY